MSLQAGEVRLYARGPIMCMPHATLQSRPSLNPSQIADRRLAASKMTGPQRRAFEAEMTVQDCGGNPLMVEAVLGWGRQTVALGLAERRTGMICLGAQAACRGRTRWEAQHPQAAQALRHLADAHAQHDPTGRTRLPSTRLTAQAACKALEAQGESEDQWPSPRTMAEVLHRMGFRWRKGVKATPQKKRKETEAIFDHREQKRTKPWPQAMSNACVGTVKRRCKAARFPVVVSPVATTEPVITLGAARRRMCLVGSWRKSAGR
jgi:transposase